MRRTETTSRSNGRPDGVSFVFQVCRYKVEPCFSCFARNLFPKRDDRSALANEPMEGGPQVPVVSKPFSFARCGERLTGARAGPDGPIVGPSGLPQGVGPDSDSGEEMALCVFQKVFWFDILDTPFVHVTRCDVTLLD